MLNGITSFQSYLLELRESIDCLDEYYLKTGFHLKNLQEIKAGLEDQDPFILIKASIAANLLLSAHTIYH